MTTLVYNTSPLVYGSTGNITLSGDSTTTYQPASKSLNISGDAEIQGDLKIKGRSLMDAIEQIEKRLGILVPEPLTPDPKLIAKYEELKELKRKYDEMEAQFKTMDVLGT